MTIKDTKFAFLSHEQEGLTGYPDMFSDYLKSHGAKITYIRYPFFVSKTKSIWVEKYDGIKLLSKTRSAIQFYKPEPVSFIKDVIWTLTVGAYVLRGSDFLIATTNLMAFTGYILKKLRIVKHVTFLMVDYSPIRFKNPIIEWIYRKIDRLATIKADSVWPIKLSMLEGRIEAGRVKREEVKKVIEAPQGTYSKVIFANGEPEYDSRHLVYIGTASAKNVRADVMVDVAEELKKRGEVFKLTLIASGQREKLQEKIKTMKIEDRVDLRPPIPGSIDLEKFISHCGIGLAPYDPNLKDNFSKFADPGKIKNYLGCGVPVISTGVIAFSQTLEDAGAGKLADLTPKDFADKIVSYWNDDVEYKKARQNARKLGEQFDWTIIFGNILKAEGFEISSS